MQPRNGPHTLLKKKYETQIFSQSDCRPKLISLVKSPQIQATAAQRPYEF